MNTPKKLTEQQIAEGWKPPPAHSPHWAPIPPTKPDGCDESTWRGILAGHLDFAFWRQHIESRGFMLREVIVPVVTSQAEYAAIPPGTVYCGSDGKKRRKPAA